jgi:acyl carrier protein
LTTAELVARLRRLNVKLWTEGERLRCNAPKGVLTAALRDELAASKPELKAWILENGDIDDARSLSPAAATANTDQIPLSFAQQRIWFIEQMQPGGFAEKLGVDDNFFDLGGHSLLVVQVRARLRETLGREVSIVDMFQYPTIRSIAAHLERQSGSFQTA